MPKATGSDSKNTGGEDQGGTSGATVQMAQGGSGAGVHSSDETKPQFVPNTQGPAQMTFPQIMGHIVTMVLEDRTLMPQAKKELEVWYLAQPLEQRKEIVKKIKSQFEYTKGIVESSYHQFMEISYGDFQ
jgi:hypothetical protein